jgi:hypothetical protein
MFARRLRAARADDGGFGPVPGVPAEPDPTALATLALDDDEGRAWLLAHQREDGSFGLAAGSVVNDAATGPAALALGPGPERERALDHLERASAASARSTHVIPHDAGVVGWAWTRNTFGWVEPTARALLALRALRPTAADAIADGVGMLRDREAAGGGWNYGNRVVYGEELAPYAQTTALALLAVRGMAPDHEGRGMSALRRLWREEADGGLSLAVATAALRVYGDPDRHEAGAALDRVFERTRFLGDTVALAWAAIATGPALQLLEPGS